MRNYFFPLLIVGVLRGFAVLAQPVIYPTPFSPTSIVTAHLFRAGFSSDPTAPYIRKDGSTIETPVTIFLIGGEVEEGGAVTSRVVVRNEGAIIAEQVGVTLSSSSTATQAISGKYTQLDASHIAWEGYDLAPDQYAVFDFRHAREQGNEFLASVDYTYDGQIKRATTLLQIP